MQDFFHQQYHWWNKNWVQGPKVVFVSVIFCWIVTALTAPWKENILNLTICLEVWLVQMIFLFNPGDFGGFQCFLECRWWCSNLQFFSSLGEDELMLTNVFFLTGSGMTRYTIDFLPLVRRDCEIAHENRNFVINQPGWLVCVRFFCLGYHGLRSCDRLQIEHRRSTQHIHLPILKESAMGSYFFHLWKLFISDEELRMFACLN